MLPRDGDEKPAPAGPSSAGRPVLVTGVGAWSNAPLLSWSRNAFDPQQGFCTPVAVITLPIARPAVLVSLGGLAIAMSMGMLLWLALPELAPGWVLQMSPFVVPAARAAVAKRDVAAFALRVQGWGDDAIPGLCFCLRHPQVGVRRVACQVVADMAQHAPLDARLKAAADDAQDDADPQVRTFARRALHRGIARDSLQKTGPGDSAAKRASAKDDDDDDDDDDDNADMKTGKAISHSAGGQHGDRSAAKPTSGHGH